jgi:hypothetical protein
MLGEALKDPNINALYTICERKDGAPKPGLFIRNLENVQGDERDEAEHQHQVPLLPKPGLSKACHAGRSVVVWPQFQCSGLDW